MSDEQFYRFTFVRPNGWQYEATGRASNETEAVRRADELLENVERIGISDLLAADGVSAPSSAPGASAWNGVAANAGAAFGSTENTRESTNRAV